MVRASVSDSLVPFNGSLVFLRFSGPLRTCRTVRSSCSVFGFDSLVPFERSLFFLRFSTKYRTVCYSFSDSQFLPNGFPLFQTLELISSGSFLCFSPSNPCRTVRSSISGLSDSPVLLERFVPRSRSLQSISRSWVVSSLSKGSLLFLRSML